VGVELAANAIDHDSRVMRTIYGCQAPNVRSVIPELGRVVHRVGALGDRRSARVLEVVDSLGTHVSVLDAAEIDPDVRVLVTEERREVYMRLPVEAGPLVGR